MNLSSVSSLHPLPLTSRCSKRKPRLVWLLVALVVPLALRLAFPLESWWSKAFLQGPTLRHERLVGRRRLIEAVLPASLVAFLGERVSAAPEGNDYESIRAAFATLSAGPEQQGATKALEGAEAAFGQAIERRPGKASDNLQAQVERCQLHSARAQVRITLNEMADGKRLDKAQDAVKDYDVAVEIMDEGFRKDPSKAMYSEYPSTLVSRALAKEELKDWKGAVGDYSKAITSWRPVDGRPDKPLRGDARPQEGDGLGVNPLVLNFRGNALSRLGRFEEAATDYREAGAIFTNDREIRQASLSRANEALAYFGAGQDLLGVQTMESVIRKDPGVTDAHVALAVNYWGRGDIRRAESEWKFACENIDTGCSSYKDLGWVAEIRRWPTPLVNGLSDFLNTREKKKP